MAVSVGMVLTIVADTHGSPWSWAGCEAAGTHKGELVEFEHARPPVDTSESPRS